MLMHLNRLLKLDASLVKSLNISVLMGALLLTAPMSHAEADWTIDQLMQSLASVQSAHASFSETKSIAILDKPVISTGELFYTAPDWLEKRTLSPKAETMLLDKDQLTVVQRGKKRVLSLQRYPEVAALIDSVRGTLAGDRTALERAYQLSIGGDAQNWRLQLVPLQDKVKKVVSAINITGTSNVLTTITVEQADGDSSHMTITPLPAP